MEFVVYILYSEKFDKTYVGYTSSLIERFKSHNSLANSGFTLKFRPWKVVYIDVYFDKSMALKKEKWLKSGNGRTFIAELKKNGFISA
ncbi:MAG: GIY-YIG nuclease family protein [Flavobacterium sp.]|nr:GIY-YIG nuclease family protein [Flavobacterium sp.]